MVGVVVVFLAIPLCIVSYNQVMHSRNRCRPTKNLATPAAGSDLEYGLGKVAYSLFPFSPEQVSRRKTIMNEVVAKQIWTLDQVQGVFNVNVPVRSTVVRLCGGGLFVSNPVAPTAECIRMLRDLEAQHGNVKYIVLSSLAIEHKGTTGAFAAYFPQAEIFVQPGQYAFPLNLPTQLFFPPGRVVQEIPTDSTVAPWYDDIDHEVLGTLKPRSAGGFAETAFYHRKTRTLLVTDIVIKVPNEPPAIIQDDSRALLYHARDTMLEVVQDTPATRRKGWRRISLFGLIFQPAGIKVSNLLEALGQVNKVQTSMRKLGAGVIPVSEALYPWDWVASEEPNFRALQGGLLVAPILQTLILNREPAKVAEWVRKVSRWSFRRIIPSHFANDVSATPEDFQAAFQFLYEPPKQSWFTIAKSILPQALPEDLTFLRGVSQLLTKQGVLYPEAPLLKKHWYKFQFSNSYSSA